MLLHGYGSNASQADRYFQLSSYQDAYGFALLLPDGTRDVGGNRFWNATHECCDIFQAEIDDVSYIRRLVDEAQDYREFDQVFAIGHSNGGFMAYSLACEDIAGLRAIVSLAGLPFAQAADCRVPSPLSVLQIHGDRDFIIHYERHRIPDHPDPDRDFTPGAVAAVTRWANRASCDSEPELLAAFDGDSAVPGDETAVQRWSVGCEDGVVVDLWTMVGSGHIPFIWNTQFTPNILDWLYDVAR